MPDAGWSVRLFETNDYGEDSTIDFFSNFKKSKARMLDTIVTFSGMYGIDNYLIWNLHKDLPHYDFSTMSLDVNIFMYKSTDIVSFQDFYRVQDIRYNTVKSQYTIYAISETTVILRSKLIGYNVTSLSYKENRTPKEILEEVLQKNNILYVVFHEDNNATKEMPSYQYRYFVIDKEWTVLDFIEYIADDNKYEWFIDTFVPEDTNKPYYILHIGHELQMDLDMDASKPLSIEIDNLSESLYSMKITTNTSPMQPLATWEQNYKCVWAKHTAGKGGGISKGCFVPVGMGHFDKHLFLRTLEGKVERSIGISMLSRRKLRIPSIGIGNILKDEGVLKDDSGKTTGVSPYIDEVSLQKNPKTLSIREPHNIIINKGDDLAVQHQLERATRSTPYLDHEAGLLFPSSSLEEGEPSPNSILFNVDGKIESSVVGPFVMGNGSEDYRIPIKEKEDFRLRFTDGAEIFYDHSKKIWFFQAPSGFCFKNVITPYDKNTTKHLTEEWDEGKSMLQIYENNLMFDSPSIHMHMMDGGCWQVVPKTGPQPDDPYRRYAIIGDNEYGKFYIEAKDGIEIEIRYQGALASGTIKINTSNGTINIGENASAINLAGGAKALAHAQHIHTIPPGPAIPGPPVSTSACTDNTTITKAD